MAALLSPTLKNDEALLLPSAESDTFRAIYLPQITDLEQKIQSQPDDINLQLKLMRMYARLGPKWRRSAKHIAGAILEKQSSNREALEVSVLPEVSSSLPHDLSEEEFSAYEALFKGELRQLLQESADLHDDGKALESLQERNSELRNINSTFKETSMGNLHRPLAGMPPSVRGLVRKVVQLKSLEDQMDIITDDLINFVEWLSYKQKIPLTTNISKLNERVWVLKAALPADLQWLAGLAFIHTEREKLGRVYQNEIPTDVPRIRFWMSQDGFAWDLTHLLPILMAVQGGMMVSPESFKIFAPEDVDILLKHPLSVDLIRERKRQDELGEAISLSTITKINQLADDLVSPSTRLEGENLVSTMKGIKISQRFPDSSNQEIEAIQHLRVAIPMAGTDGSVDVVTINSILQDISADTFSAKLPLHGQRLKQAVEYITKHYKSSNAEETITTSIIDPSVLSAASTWERDEDEASTPTISELSAYV